MTNFFLKNEAFAFLLIACATILTALGFEHIAGYIPCKLCLGQRIPYYTAIPLAAVTCVVIWRGASPTIQRLLFALLAMLMIWSVFLAVRHTGVEYSWWEGPGDCGATKNNIVGDANSLLNQLKTTHAPSCDEAAGRFLGLSFAGWNVISSVVLLLITLRGLLKKA